MKLIEDYVIKNLSHELKSIQNSSSHKTINLTDFEKALIYKYSNDGFRRTNKLLLASRGLDFDDFGMLLYSAISKLPDFNGIVYRKVFLTSGEIGKYSDALKTQNNIIEYPFISTSKFISVAVIWEGQTNVNPNSLFVIYTRSGKEIELMSKFTDEKEVVLKPNTQFKVLNIFVEPDFIQITMEEV
ncbi:MAG: ADP-ribosyltransferase domain-containing protein [Ginsengibacter sp.]